MKKYKYRKPHSYKRKKSVLKSRFFCLGVLIFLLSFGLVYFLFFSSFFQLEKVVVSGEEKIHEEQIASFIPPGNILLIDLSKAIEEILEKHPQIAKVQLKRSLPDKINILVTERTGLAVWRRGEERFLLDKEGIIFERVKEVLPLSCIGRGKDEEKALGERVIGEDELEKILFIDEKLRFVLQIPIEESIIQEDRLDVKTQEGWQAYFDLAGDLEWQLTKLNAVLTEKIPPERRGDLEYIELRFGNLAPFKYLAN